MRSVLRTVVAAGALTATMLVGGLAGSASAAPATATPLRGGTTTVTTGPGIATTLRTGRSLTISNFVIDTRTGALTARVNRTSTRIAVFTLDLSAATVDASGNTVKVGNIDVRLTAAAAGALNQTLGTHVFTGGLDLGTARTTLRV